MTDIPVASLLRDVTSATPLVHHITNYVTVNDCANITLCAGGAPVMAHDPAELEEMIQFAGALVLNIGTLDSTQIDAMLIAGRAAEKRDIPIILDPVGAGATSLRTKTAHMLIQELSVAVLKGNAGEIGVLAGADASVRGVDSAGLSGKPAEITADYAEKAGMTVIMSGPADVISNGNDTFVVENGNPLMGRVSGTGCMAASVTGVYNAVTKDRIAACVSALSTFGLAGEKAARNASGPGSYKVALFDALASLTPEELETGARIRRL